MNQEIIDAAKGLYFISESDHPLEYFMLSSGQDIESQLRSLSEHKNGKIESQTLNYFLRNMTKELEGEDPSVPQRFQHLQQVLENNLNGIQVYRIGEVQVDAFIIGKNNNEKFEGLRTKLIET